MKKPVLVVVVLAFLLATSVPALAQLVYSPETGEYIDCTIAGGTTAEFCLANGIDPPVEYAVHPDGGFVYTPVGLPGYTGDEIEQEIRAQIQYDNADTARCMDPLADHRGCATFINPDGTLSQV